MCATARNAPMLKFASASRFNCVVLRKILLGTVAAALTVGVVLETRSIPAAAEATAVPALSGNGLGWISVGGFLDPPPGIGHGPVTQDPAHPFHGNLDGPGQVTPTIGNVKDPILKPWAAAQMQVSNDEVLSGQRGLPFSAQGRCYPGGVPGQLLYPIEPLYFIQTPKQVWMIWQRDHMVRRIYLTDQHSETVKPSWFGESIGHYESDGTLVVDTIGLSASMSFLDWYRTPHSEKEHVTERYRLTNNENTLEVLVTVEDADTFNEP